MLFPSLFLAAVSSGPRILDPVVEGFWYKLSILIAGLAVTMLLSGVVVRGALGISKPAGPKNGRDVHALIGKCENFIAYVLILAGQETGLALIFAAKSLVRAEDIKKDPSFFLGGTLVNFVWSMLVAVIVRVLLIGL